MSKMEIDDKNKNSAFKSNRKSTKNLSANKNTSMKKKNTQSNKKSESKINTIHKTPASKK